MSVFEIGRLVMKIAGRDAGGKGVVVEQLDSIYVLVDGGLRRKKVNIKHLEPLSAVIELNSGAAHEEVKRAFEKLGLLVWEKKAL
jgi:large subunit ribosomal protein L14e